MFAVVFVVEPDPHRFSAYIDIAKSLRPELEAIDGFVDNLRYRSLIRPTWLLSLSLWADEKALVRWRTREHHHFAQQKGRDELLLDYHLRVGQIVKAEGEGLSLEDFAPASQQRPDQTHVGEAKMLVLVDGHRIEPGVEKPNPSELAVRFGLDPGKNGDQLVSWDVMEAVLTPGDMILLSSWSSEDAARDFCRNVPSTLRYRQIRVIRDYGKYDRREAPQFYKDALGRETIH